MGLPDGDGNLRMHSCWPAFVFQTETLVIGGRRSSLQRKDQEARALGTLLNH